MIRRILPSTRQFKFAPEGCLRRKSMDWNPLENQNLLARSFASSPVNEAVLSSIEFSHSENAKEGSYLSALSESFAPTTNYNAPAKKSETYRRNKNQSSANRSAAVAQKWVTLTSVADAQSELRNELKSWAEEGKPATIRELRHLLIAFDSIWRNPQFRDVAKEWDNLEDILVQTPCSKLALVWLPLLEQQRLRGLGEAGIFDTVQIALACGCKDIRIFNEIFRSMTYPTGETLVRTLDDMLAYKLTPDVVSYLEALTALRRSCGLHVTGIARSSFIRNGDAGIIGVLDVQMIHEHLIRTLSLPRTRVDLTDVLSLLRPNQWINANSENDGISRAFLESIKEDDDGHGPTLRNYLQRVSYRKLLLMYNTLMACYAAFGGFDSAFLVLQHCKDSGIHPDRITYHSLIQAVRRTRRPDATLILATILEEMKGENSPSNDTYQQLLSAFVDCGAIGEAVELLEVRRNNAMTLPNANKIRVSPDSEYSRVMVGCLRSNRLDLAQKVWDSWKLSGEPVSPYSLTKMEISFRYYPDNPIADRLWSSIRHYTFVAP